MAPRHCTNCGAELSSGAKFCADCGTPVRDPSAEDPYPIDTILKQTIAALLILIFVIAIYIGFIA